MPKVSVITIVHNGQEYIKEAIESILSQTFTDFEYIIIDDASDDRTYELVSEQSIKDKRISLHQNQRRLGIALTRNRGVEISSGKYIAWQDADDVSFPNRLESQVNFLDENSEIGIVGGSLMFIGNKSRSIRKYPVHDFEIRKKILRYMPLAQPAAMIKSEIYSLIGGYNDKCNTEDLEFLFRASRYFKMSNLDAPVILYREHPKSFTFKNARKLEIEATLMRLKSKLFGYQLNIFDYFYYSLQLITIFLVPQKLRIFLFKFFRNRSV